MTDKPIHINPWLAERIKEYRQQRGEEMLRNDYDIVRSMGSKLSWEQLLAHRALDYAMRWDPFLMTLACRTGLPSSISDYFYSCHIDTVADMLQLSEEEFAELAQKKVFELKPIEDFLQGHGYKLLSCPEKTYKLSTLPFIPSARVLMEDSIWMAGEEWTFDIERPSCTSMWFDTYCSKYEHVEGEEMLRQELSEVRPDMNEEMPSDFQEFFQAVNTLFDTYGSICESQNIKPLYFRPDDLPCEAKDLKFFQNCRFLELRELALLAVIDIFERTYLFKHYTVGKYLSATDEEKLNMAEVEEENQDFQLLLITHVEIRVDFDCVMDYIKTIASAAGKPQVQQKVEANPEKHALNEKMDPVNPWLAEAVKEIRVKYTDNYLRVRYVSFLDDCPEKDWTGFLEELALYNKTRDNDFLLTKRIDFGLPQRLTDVLNTLGVDVVADLMQFTIEELTEMLEQSGESVELVVQFLANHGYKLYSYPSYTHKMPLESVDQEKKEQAGVIKDAMSKADSIMKDDNVPLAKRVEKALETYKANEHLARVVDIDLKTQVALAIDYGRFCEEYMQQFPEVAKEAAGVGQRALYFSELIHGEKGRKTAGVHRLNGAILTKLEEHREAARHYAAAAAIMEEIAKPDDIWVGKDYRSAAVCNTRIPDYQKALELFFKAVDVFKKHPEKPQELEETYWNIAKCYRQLKDKENEEKYRLLAAATRTTDEI